MIPTVRPFCKMGTSIKRRGKLWISGEFTENKRCAMIFMLGGLPGQEIRNENRGSKPASSVFLNIRIAFAQHCRAGGLPLPRISPTAEFASSEGRSVCRFLPGGKGIFRLWRKIPARASPSPYRTGAIDGRKGNRKRFPFDIIPLIRRRSYSSRRADRRGSGSRRRRGRYRRRYRRPSGRGAP